MSVRTHRESNLQSESRRRFVQVALAAGVPMAAIAAFPHAAAADDAVVTSLENYAGAISAADYGFLPSASGTDNRDNLQMAINAAIAGGYELYIPAGDYTVTFEEPDGCVSNGQTPPRCPDIIDGNNSIAVNGSVTITGVGGRVRIFVGPSGDRLWDYHFLYMGPTVVNLNINNMEIVGPESEGSYQGFSAESDAIFCNFVDQGTSSSLTMQDVTISGNFLQAVWLTSGGSDRNGGGDINIENSGSLTVTMFRCDLTAAFQTFVQSANPNAGPRTVILYQTTIHDSGYSGSTNGGNVVYVHSETATLASECWFHGARGGQVWQALASFQGPTPEYLMFDKCHFGPAASVYPSLLGHTVFTDCEFVGEAGVYKAQDLEMTNCLFQTLVGDTLAVALWGRAQPGVVLRGCTFDFRNASAEIFQIVGDATLDSSGVYASDFAPTLVIEDCVYMLGSSQNFIAECDSVPYAGYPSGRVEIANSRFELGTGGGSFLAGDGVWRVRGCTFTGAALSGLFELSPPTGSPPSEVVAVYLEDCDFSGLGGSTILLESPYEGTTYGIGKLFGRNNLFGTGTDPHTPAGRPRMNAGYAYIAPLSGTSPCAIDSASSPFALDWNYDTFHVTGTGSVTNVTVGEASSELPAFSGTVRLLADGPWTLVCGATGPGSILTRDGTTRTVIQGGAVVLTFDPATLTWYEEA